MFVTLSDFSTYDRNAFFVSLNEDGLAQLDANNDMKNVDLKNYNACISIHDLLDAYNQIHGTDF